jgi:hypothetical protein
MVNCHKSRIFRSIIDFLLLNCLIPTLGFSVASFAQDLPRRDDSSSAFDEPAFTASQEKLRQKMEKAALEDEHSFIGKLSRQIELEKNKFVTNVKNASSKSEADIEVNEAKTELRRFLDVCKDVRVVGRYYVLDIKKVTNPESEDKQFLIDCRIDEPEIDWEERGTKTRNCTRRVEHSFFYVDEVLARKIRKSDVILVQGQIEIIDSDLKNDDELPYLMVVSANYDVLSGRLSEAGAKNNRIAKLLIENYLVTLESEEEKKLRIKAKQKAVKSKKQFVANAFAEKVAELIKARSDKLVNAATSSQRDDIIRSSDRAFVKFLSSCNSQSFSLRLTIEDVRKDGFGHVAICVISRDQPDDDISFASNSVLTTRQESFPVLVKDNIGRLAKPDDSLIVEGAIEIIPGNQVGYERKIDSKNLGSKTRLPLFGVGDNVVFLVLKDVVYESAE